MNVFLPYKYILECAKCLDSKRFNKQIIEIDTMLNGKWSNHPVYKMYIPQHRDFLIAYRDLFIAYRNKANTNTLIELNDLCNMLLPNFIDDNFCMFHARRLYTKNNEHYKQFAYLGTSDVNIYFVNGEYVYYENGKKLNK